MPASAVTINTQTTNAATNLMNEVLHNQEEVKRIVDAENAKLENGIASIRDEATTKRRLAVINDSRRKRMNGYNLMLFIIIITLVLFWALTYLSSYLPEIIIVLLMVIIGVLAVIWCYNIYLEISNRSKLNYDELLLKSPKQLTPQQREREEEKARQSGNLLGSVNLMSCYGSDCCDTGTEWDTDKLMCIPTTDASTTEPFTTLAPQRSYGNVSANTPNEYDKYSPIH